MLKNNKGKVLASSLEEINVNVPDYKIISFWDRIEEIGVWKWRKKYPYSKLKYEQLLDGYNWELKLRDRNGRGKIKKTKYILFGSLDDFWFNLDTDELVVSYYKATSNKNLEDYTNSTKHYHKSYLRQ